MTVTAKDLFQLDGILDKHLMELMRQTLYLMEREARQPVVAEIVDYGFLVFSGAIVYEGFLKRFLYTLGLISATQLRSDNFRIGKALNPDLPERYRDDAYVYTHVEQLCSRKVAVHLWEAWKFGRNQVFHYDFLGKKNISFEQAEERLARFFEAMIAAAQCEKQIKRD
jgi:hypothetical protein